LKIFFKYSKYFDDLMSVHSVEIASDL